MMHLAYDHTWSRMFSVFSAFSSIKLPVGTPVVQDTTDPSIYWVTGAWQPRGSPIIKHDLATHGCSVTCQQVIGTQELLSCCDGYKTLINVSKQVHAFWETGITEQQAVQLHALLMLFSTNDIGFRNALQHYLIQWYGGF